MTVTQLSKALHKLIDEGKGRYKVTVEKESFQHVLSEVGIHDVEGIEARFIPLCDDDGGTATNKDGSERGIRCLVLKGGAS